MSGSGDKSEKPSASKLKKARGKGDIPRSRDVTMAATLVVSFVCLGAFFPYYKVLVDDAFIAMRQMAERINDDGALQQFLLVQVSIILKVAATLLPIPFSGVIASVVPGGWIFVLTRVKPDFKKLSPISGVKRLFSRQHLTDVLKMMLKCVVLLGLLWLMVKQNLGELLGLQNQMLSGAITQGLILFESMMRLFVMTLVAFALIDVPLSKFLFTKKMKMTKQEVRDEYKNSEGNPQIKARLRGLQRQMAMGQINKQVPTADVVITNPTHFAVALKYDPDKAAAPYIVAKGVDDVALYIREVAAKNKVSVVEFPPLARAVYHSTRINQQIPASLFRPMAHVLTYVMQLKSWREGNGEKPRLDTRLSKTEEVILNHGSV